MADRLHAGWRRTYSGPYLISLGAAVLPLAAFRACLRTASAPPAAAAADRGAAVGPLRHAAARDRGGPAALPRHLRHRVGRRPDGAARRRPLRSRRLHRL